MPETVTLSRIYLEDLDVGIGTRDVRLFDGSTAALTRIHLGVLPQLRTTSVSCTNAATVLTATNIILAGDRVLGVTCGFSPGVGTTRGLTALAIGDSGTINRWGTITSFGTNASTSQADFTLEGWPIYPSNESVIISAIGGTFDGTGIITVTVHYMRLTHRVAS